MPRHVIPSMTGIEMSSVTTSGLSRATCSSASLPSAAMPATVRPGSSAIRRATVRRTRGESSTTSTRMGEAVTGSPFLQQPGHHGLEEGIGLTEPETETLFPRPQQVRRVEGALRALAEGGPALLEDVPEAEEAPGSGAGEKESRGPLAEAFGGGREEELARLLRVGAGRRVVRREDADALFLQDHRGPGGRHQVRGVRVQRRGSRGGDDVDARVSGGPGGQRLKDGVPEAARHDERGPEAGGEPVEDPEKRGEPGPPRAGDDDAPRGRGWSLPPACPRPSHPHASDPPD